MDVIPQSNLPDISQAWGKNITAKVSELYEASERNSQDALNNSKSLAGSVAKLAEQVLFIQSLRTYAVTGGGASTSAGGTTVLETLTLPPVVLTRTSTVLIQYTTSVSGYASHTAVNPNPLTRLSEYITIDGAVQAGGGSLASGVQLVTAGVTGMASQFEGSRVHPVIATLPAGTHTIVGGCSGYIFGSSGTVTLNSSSLTLSIIG